MDDLAAAKKCFYEKKYNDALNLFLKEKEYYGAGLCSLLLKAPEAAETYWKKKKKSCPACAFGLCILDYINFKTPEQPSFFQTRAQLEIYLNLFLENGLLEYAENLISSCDSLYLSNPESYKFIARALFANGY